MVAPASPTFFNKKGIIAALVDNHPRLTSLGSIVLYAIAFVVFYPLLRSGIVAALALLPAMLIGWLLGVRAGIGTGIGLTVLNFVLFSLMGKHALVFILLGPGLLGNVLIIIAGALSGWTGTLFRLFQQRTWQLAQEQSVLHQEMKKRQQIEEELVRREKRTQALLEAFPDLVFSIDHNGQLLAYWTDTSNDLYIEPTRIVGSFIADVMPEAFTAKCLPAIRKTIATGLVQSFEYELTIQDTLQSYEARMAQSGLAEVVAVVRNITQRKQAEQQQVKWMLEQQKVALLREFIGNLSHDLKTPLTIINNNIYLLEHLGDPHKNKQKLEVIRQQTERLNRIIEDILALSELDQQTIVTQEDVELADLVRQVVAELEVLVSRKRQQLHLDLPTDTITILGDAHLLHRMLSNLLANAVHYTPDQGEISIELRHNRATSILEIRDTGIGIAQEDLTHIFERFYRADKARTSSKSGTGLGLSIVKQIIELHGGHIEVTSTEGTGSCFRVRLPSAPARV